MISILLIVCFFFGSIDITDENIKGKVVDLDTREPVSYVHISIENSPLGTVTNEDGIFSLIVPSSYSNSKLVVTHVGYEKLIVSFHQMSTNSTFKIKPIIITLDEVTVSGLNPFEIIKEASNKRKENYPFYPSKLTGFYRHGIKIDDKYTQFLETSLEIVMPHYGLILNNSKTDREIYVNELRAFETDNYYSVSPYRLFDDLFFIPVNEKSYDVEIILGRSNDSEIVISAIPKVLTSGLPGFQLTIDKKSYAYKEIQYYIPNEFWETKDFTERTLVAQEGKKKTIKERRTKFLVTYSFYNYNDKWHLKQINQSNKFAIVTENEQPHNVIYYINYVTQNISEDVSGQNKKNLLSKDQDIYSLKRKNNRPFWGSFAAHPRHRSASQSC